MFHSSHVLGIAAFSPSFLETQGRGNAAAERSKDSISSAQEWETIKFSYASDPYRADFLPPEHSLSTSAIIPMVAPGNGGPAARTIVLMAGPSASGTTYFVWDGEDILVETHGSDSVWIN